MYYSSSCERSRAIMALLFLKSCYYLNPWLAAHVICRLLYADIVAPNQPAHPRSLIWSYTVRIWQTTIDVCSKQRVNTLLLCQNCILSCFKGF